MKKITALLLVMVLAMGLAACGKNQPEPETETTAAQQLTQQFTGVLEDKKDFMIVVTGEDGTPYVFNLDRVVCPAEVGQTVTVTYTGDMADYDAQLIARKVEMVRS